MNILQNISLKGYNTFGIDKKAKYFSIAKTVEELKELLAWAKAEAVSYTHMTQRTIYSV